MFEKQQLIGNGFALPQRHELLLQVHAVLVRDETQVPKLADAHHFTRTKGKRQRPRFDSVKPSGVNSMV